MNKSNTVSVSEALAYAAAIVLADSASMSEAAAIGFSFPESDSMSLSDSPALGFGAGLADSTSISESIDVLLIIGKGSKFNQSVLNVITLNG